MDIKPVINTKSQAQQELLAFDVEKIRGVLKALEKSQTRWCTETVDDAEEMWLEIPGLLDWAVDELRTALNMPVFAYKAVYGIPDKEVDVTRFLQVYRSPKQIRIRATASNANFKCDPAPGRCKRLVITYSYGETNKREFFAEGTQVYLDVELV